MTSKKKPTKPKVKVKTIETPVTISEMEVVEETKPEIKAETTETPTTEFATEATDEPIVELSEPEEKADSSSKETSAEVSTEFEPKSTLECMQDLLAKNKLNPADKQKAIYTSSSKLVIVRN